MNLDGRLIQQVTDCAVPSAVNCSRFGLVTADEPDTLSFVDEERYVAQLTANPNITAAFITPELASRVGDSHVVPIVCEDPRYAYFSLYNHVAEASYESWPSRIDPSAQIHPRAYVAENNVIIGPNCVVQPNVTILPDVEMGEGCLIRAGAVLGSAGYEHKRTRRGILTMVHDGKAILGSDVEIGSNASVQKGLRSRHTVVGDSTRAGDLVLIAHAVQIGRRCFLPASVMISGSVTIGDDAWIGPASMISNQINIGDGAFVTIGSVVTRDVPAGARVTGNFAVPHEQFLAALKRSISP
jgi:UDP-3-O-[3-hydroxymyristoyl] glucosamine N-acyltransferase